MPIQCKINELANTLGISTRQLQRLVKRGIITKGENNLFSIDEAIQNYLKYKLQRQRLQIRNALKLYRSRLI